MNIDKLFILQTKLPDIEGQFFRVQEDVGFPNPILFFVDYRQFVNATELTVNSINEALFNIHFIFNGNQTTLAYLIDSKYPKNTHVFRNGIVIKQNRSNHKSKPKVKFNFDDFQIVTNQEDSAAMFCRNITQEQKT